MGSHVKTFAYVYVNENGCLVPTKVGEALLAERMYLKIHLNRFLLCKYQMPISWNLVSDQNMHHILKFVQLAS